MGSDRRSENDPVAKTAPVRVLLVTFDPRARERSCSLSGTFQHAHRTLPQFDKVRKDPDGNEFWM